MVELDENSLNRIMRRLSRRAVEPSTRAGCRDEGSMALYLSDGLAEAERSEMESHLAACRFCLEELVGAYRAAQGVADEIVPHRAWAKVVALVPQTEPASHFFELTVRLMKDSLALISTSGELVSATAPGAIRGKSNSPASGTLQVAKELDGFRVTIEVERTESELSAIVVNVKPMTGGLADGLRFSLVSGNREHASYLARQGSATFDRISPGEYQLALTHSGKLLGVIKLTIKEGGP